MLTPATWRWLKETWGLSSDDAARAAAWAVKTLGEAVGAAPPDPPEKTKPRSAARRSKKEKRR
jgi:hypothetical protein